MLKLIRIYLFIFQLIKKPTLTWNADPNALYTLLIEDNDITSAPIKWAQWLVTNIPGTLIRGVNSINTASSISRSWMWKLSQLY